MFYNVRTRQLHRHKVYLEMYEWILWTGVIVFSLMLVYALFRFDWIIVLATLVIGLGTFVWIRFFRFPPYFRAYERQLAKQRYFSRERFAKPEATIRTKSSRRPPAPLTERRAVPIEVRRFGVGHRRPEGPPGTVGIEGQVIAERRARRHRRAGLRPARADRRPIPTRTRRTSS